MSDGESVGIVSFGDKPNVQKGASGIDVESLRKAEASQQADVDEHTGAEWYDPPYDPEQLVRLSERHEAHAACVSAKSRNVAGFGLDLTPVDGIDDESPPGEDDVRDFWFGLDTTFQLGPDKQQATYSEVLEHGWDDFEQTGWLALELLVNPNNGEPTGLAHIPAHTIRKLRDKRGYVQIDDGQTIEGYFGEAGDRYSTEGNEEQFFINAETGDVGQSAPEVGGPENVANELIVLRNYSALAPHYGTPDIIPGLETVSGDISARKWNGKLFENDTVPRMAVIVEGGELSDRSWQELEQKFQNISLDENTHRGILIEAQQAADVVGDSNDISIRLEPLTVGIEEDADFMDYRASNRRDILRAHNVPPVIIGDTDSVNYSNAESQRVEFAQSTIRPKQERYAARLYQVIHVLGFGVEGWAPEFRLRNGENDEREAAIAQTRIEASMGSMTINEAREELGLSPLEDGSGNELPQGRMLLASLQQSGPAGMPSADEVASAVEQARTSHDAAEKGYSLKRRDLLKSATEKATYSEGDVVEYDGDGHLGVVVSVQRESFTIPVGDEDEEEVDASSDSPVYVVARQTGGFDAFTGSELSSGSIPDDEQGDPSEIDADEVEAHKAGWSRLPDGWSRLTLLDAWSSMGGQFDCGGACCMGELRSERLCASMKDEVMGTTRWRGRF